MLLSSHVRFLSLAQEITNLRAKIADMEVMMSERSLPTVEGLRKSLGRLSGVMDSDAAFSTGIPNPAVLLDALERYRRHAHLLLTKTPVYH